MAEMFLKLCQIHFGKNCLWLIFHNLGYLNWFQDLFFRLFKTGSLKGGMCWLSRLGTFAKRLLFSGTFSFGILTVLEEGYLSEYWIIEGCKYSLNARRITSVTISLIADVPSQPAQIFWKPASLLVFKPFHTAWKSLFYHYKKEQIAYL